MLLAALAARASDVCNPADLVGPYVFQLTGTTDIAGGRKPTVSLGRLVFDGHGALTGTSSAAFQGLLLGNPVTGTYEAKSDCTVRWKLQDDSGGYQNFSGTFAPDAASGQFKQSDPGGAQRGILKKTADACLAADLSKKYSFSVSGITTPLLEGQTPFTVSGKGTLDVAENGTFEVDSDCSVRFQLVLLIRTGSGDETSEMNMRGFLVNGGKEILAFQTDLGTVVAARLTAEGTQPSNSR